MADMTESSNTHVVCTSSNSAGVAVVPAASAVPTSVTDITAGAGSLTAAVPVPVDEASAAPEVVSQPFPETVLLQQVPLPTRDLLTSSLLLLAWQ